MTIYGGIYHGLHLIIARSHNHGLLQNTPQRQLNRKESVVGFGLSENDGKNRNISISLHLFQGLG